MAEEGNQPEKLNGSVVLEENDIDKKEKDHGDVDGEDIVIGPGLPAPRHRLKRPLQFEEAFLAALPSAHMLVELNNQLNMLFLFD